jgi:hypothetical protein
MKLGAVVEARLMLVLSLSFCVVRVISLLYCVGKKSDSHSDQPNLPPLSIFFFNNRLELRQKKGPLGSSLRGGCVKVPLKRKVKICITINNAGV